MVSTFPLGDFCLLVYKQKLETQSPVALRPASSCFVCLFTVSALFSALETPSSHVPLSQFRSRTCGRGRLHQPGLTSVETVFSGSIRLGATGWEPKGGSWCLNGPII